MGSSRVDRRPGGSVVVRGVVGVGSVVVGEVGKTAKNSEN